MSDLGKEILTTDDRLRRTVEAWGTTFELRELSAADVQFADSRKDNSLKLAAIVARSAVNGDGQRMFSDADLPQLADKGLTTLQRLVSIVENLSGLGDDAEDAEKNLDATASAEPGSD